MSVYALRLDSGDRYEVGLYESAMPVGPGARIEFDERTWDVVETATLRLDTPDGAEEAVQLICRPAA